MSEPRKIEVPIPGLAGVLVDFNRRFNTELDKEEMTDAQQAIVNFAERKERKEEESK